MWYEILPAAGIMMGFLCVPPVAAYYVQSFFQNGNPCKRTLANEFERRQYLRDVRLTGSSYKLAGLDAIPDKK